MPKSTPSSSTSHPSDRHTLIEFGEGNYSVKPLASAESMHSRIGPWQEAQLIYIGQSGLENALRRDTASPLVLFDVGLGIAANALAALELYAKADAATATGLRPLQIFSFENDVSGLELALQNRDKFPFLEPHVGTLESVLENHAWESGKISWRLLEGDFRERVRETPPPEIVFYDFYSAKVCPELWSVECFEKVKGAHTRLCTYSVATPVRVALLLAGFHVGYGPPTGVKNGTTVAATDRRDIATPLDDEWLEHLRRSGNPYPYGWQESGKTFEELEAAVLASAHFSHAR